MGSLTAKKGHKDNFDDGRKTLALMISNILQIAMETLFPLTLHHTHLSEPFPTENLESSSVT